MVEVGSEMSDEFDVNMTTNKYHEALSGAGDV